MIITNISKEIERMRDEEHCGELYVKEYDPMFDDGRLIGCDDDEDIACPKCGCSHIEDEICSACGTEVPYHTNFLPDNDEYDGYVSSYPEPDWMEDIPF